MNEHDETDAPLNQRHRIATMDEARDAVAQVLALGLYRVDILSPALDPRLYDQAPVVDAIRRVIVDARQRARVRILVAEPETVAQRGHRLMNLARTVTTHMGIRQLSPDDRQDPPAWLLVDGAHYARWEPDSDYEGIVGLRCRGDAGKLLRTFDEYWERSVSDPGLRRLHI